MAYDLEFEKPLAELEKKINGLQRKGERLRPDELRQLHDAESELRNRTREIYSHLSAWETVQVARHKDRPYSGDYLRMMCEDFFELHGDRSFSDDHAIMAGPAKLDGTTVMFVCHQKGRDMKEKQFRNLGMPHPECYRKAGRILQQAEHCGVGLPIATGQVFHELPYRQRPVVPEDAQGIKLSVGDCKRFSSCHSYFSHRVTDCSIRFIT